MKAVYTNILTVLLIVLLGGFLTWGIVVRTVNRHVRAEYNGLVSTWESGMRVAREGKTVQKPSLYPCQTRACSIDEVVKIEQAEQAQASAHEASPRAEPPPGFVSHDVCEAQLSVAAHAAWAFRYTSPGDNSPSGIERQRRASLKAKAAAKSAAEAKGVVTEMKRELPFCSAAVKVCFERLTGHAQRETDADREIAEQCLQVMLDKHNCRREREDN